MTAALLWCAFALSASANPFPLLHDVTGVATNDILNIHRHPTITSGIVGQLTRAQTNVEVLDSDASGEWGLVNIGEGTGWVTMRYLRRTVDSDDYTLTREFHCIGTEPFWSLDVAQGQSAIFSTLAGDEQTFPAGLVKTGTGRTDRFLLDLGEGAIAVIAKSLCSDGMSDRLFGLEINLVTGTDGRTLYSGCCSITPR